MLAVKDDCSHLMVRSCSHECLVTNYLSTWASQEVFLRASLHNHFNNSIHKASNHTEASIVKFWSMDRVVSYEYSSFYAVALFVPHIQQSHRTTELVAWRNESYQILKTQRFTYLIRFILREPTHSWYYLWRSPASNGRKLLYDIINLHIPYISVGNINNLVKGALRLQLHWCTKDFQDK